MREQVSIRNILWPQERGTESMPLASVPPDSYYFVTWPFAQTDLTNKSLWNLQLVLYSCITFAPSMVKGISQVMIRQQLHESFRCSFTGSKWYLITLSSVSDGHFGAFWFCNNLPVKRWSRSWKTLYLPSKIVSICDFYFFRNNVTNTEGRRGLSVKMKSVDIFTILLLHLQ